jgi:ankyrin repeat protein
MERVSRPAFVQQHGTRALFWAVVTAHKPLIRFFLESRVNHFAQGLDFPDADLWRMDRWRPLQSHASILREYGVDEYGSESNLPTKIVLPVWCSTPFQAACVFKDEDVINTFLAWSPAVKGLDFRDVRTNQLSAAYLNAICSGNTELENLIAENEIDEGLVKSTMDFSSMVTHYRLGLQSAMVVRNLQLAKRLLDLGADRNAPAILAGSRLCDTSLQCAAMNDKAEGFVKTLLERGADPNAPAGEYCKTALQHTASPENFENVQLLREYGSDINARASKHGYTALRTAAIHSRLDMTIYLLDQGADVKGRRNSNYLEGVRGAWATGNHTLAKMIQDGKKQHYGEED